MSSIHICIIGNGIIAKTAAIILAKSNFHVTLLTPLINKNAIKYTQHLNQDSRAYAINQITRTLLIKINIWNILETKKYITPVENIKIIGESKYYPGQLIFDAYTARVKTLTWIIENQHLITTIDTALKSEQNICIINDNVINIKINSENISLKLTNGTTLNTVLLIGADGAKSWVRRQCAIGLDYYDYNQQIITTNFICEKPHYSIAYQWFTSNEGILAILPLSNQRISVVWSMPNILAQSLLYQPTTRLIQHLKKYITTQFGTLIPQTQKIIHSFPLILMKPHTITAERIVLIGDAAHVIHPLTGHGMNLGFADISTLIKILNATKDHSDCGDYKILKRYERARKKEILLMQYITYGLVHLFQNNITPLCFARNVALNLINRSSILKRYFVIHALGKSND